MKKTLTQKLFRFLLVTLIAEALAFLLILFFISPQSVMENEIVKLATQPEIGLRSFSASFTITESAQTTQRRGLRLCSKKAPLFPRGSNKCF